MNVNNQKPNQEASYLEKYEYILTKVSAKTKHVITEWHDLLKTSKSGISGDSLVILTATICKYSIEEIIEEMEKYRNIYEMEFGSIN